MNGKDLKSLAELLSSEEITEQLETASVVRQLLSPPNLLAAWRDSQQSGLLKSLLSEAQTVRNPDVMNIIGESLTKLLSDKTHGKEFIDLDKELTVPQFILQTLASEDLGLTAIFHKAFVALLQLTAREAVAKPIGVLMDFIFDTQTIPRLFDCDAAESEENAQVYHYIRAHTRLIETLISATTEDFETDPLLLVNCLVVCGIISRHEPLSGALLEKIQHTLDSPVEELYTSFVCRFCSIALFRHEGNAQRYADDWIPPAVQISERSFQEGTLDAAFELMASACTTATGCRRFTTHFAVDRLLQRLRLLAPSQRLRALLLLKAWVSSPFMDPSAISLEVLSEAWKLHTTAEEEVRRAVWEVVVAILRCDTFRDALAPMYASFLCSGKPEVSTGVRALQLQAARLLSDCPKLPESTKLCLLEVNRKGLYPPGSAAVADVPKY